MASSGAPDSSLVNENPDFEYDEEGRPMDFEDTPEGKAAANGAGEEDPLSVEECRDLAFLMYSKLREQSFLYAAFKNSLLGLTCGTDMRASLNEQHAEQAAAATKLLTASSSSELPLLRMTDAAQQEHATATAAKLEALQKEHNAMEIADVFSQLGEDASVCAEGTSMAIVQAVENGVPVIAFGIGGQVHTAAWEGQAYLQFNPLAKRIELTVFRFVCPLTPDDITLFDNAPRSKRAMRRMFEHQARFQVSHMLRLCIPIESITAISLHATPHNPDSARLNIAVSAAPLIQRRRINSTVTDSNTWRTTRDWTRGQATRDGSISIVAYSDLLVYLIGMITGASASVRGLLESGVVPPPSVPLTPSSGVAVAVAAEQKAAHKANGLEDVSVEFSDSDTEFTF